MTIWHTPEELIDIGFRRSRVVMMNEAHNGLKRCIRTRQIGQRILPTAHTCGVRHLAMEALPPPFAEECNQTRQVPFEKQAGYMAQPEMIEFIQAALQLGWTLISYEADRRKWFKNRSGIDVQMSSSELQKHQAEMLSVEYTNWREEQQALNLIVSLQSMPAGAPLLVWCGNSHHSKVIEPQWLPMGFQFHQHGSIDPFVIDQTPTVKFDNNEVHFEFVKQFADELNNLGGTAGFLTENAPAIFGSIPYADAFILSIHNELE